ncbi:MAG TPA: hypothetical protein VKI44_05785 [Acetobacteraceae bacterium]|nr:hypothetical protein [Acetobacteraceae bacterium]
MLGYGRRTLRGLLLAVLPSIWSAPGAWAQQPDRPLTLPKRDVAVIYRFEGSGTDGMHKMQVTYADAGERVRIDYFRWFEEKLPYLSLIFDHPADRLISVEAERQAYFERQIGNHDNPGVFMRTDMRLTRLGMGVVGNAPCTEWKVEVPGKDDKQGKACVTDDGIVLDLASTTPSVTSLIAAEVRYGPPPDGTFDPPAGFRRDEPP